MAVDTDIDVDLLKSEIKKTYSSVSEEPGRDFGFVAGALIAGFAADATSPKTAIATVAALTAASGLVVAATRWQSRPTLKPAPVR